MKKFIENNDFVEYISDIFIWSASSEFPIRVINFLIPKLENHINLIENSLVSDDSYWIYIYKMHISVLMIIKKVLSPWMSSNSNIINESEQVIIQNIMNLCNKSIISIITLNISHSDNNEVLKYKMLHPIANLLEAKLYINQLDIHSNNINNYYFLTHLLGYISNLQESNSNIEINKNITSEFGYLLLKFENCQRILQIIYNVLN